jgi:hypothetical protein
MNSHSLADGTLAEINEDQPPFAGLSRCGRQKNQPHPRRSCTWACMHSMWNGSISSISPNPWAAQCSYGLMTRYSAAAGTSKLGSPTAEPIRASEPHSTAPMPVAGPIPRPLPSPLTLRADHDTAMRCGRRRRPPACKTLTFRVLPHKKQVSYSPTLHFHVERK